MSNIDQDSSRELAEAGAAMLADLAELYGCEQTEEAINHALYKDTERGASVTFNHARPVSATIHTIVEGSDAEFSTDPIIYSDDTAKFIAAWREAVEWIEGEAGVAWREAND